MRRSCSTSCTYNAWNAWNSLPMFETITFQKNLFEEYITFWAYYRGYLLQQWLQEWPHIVISFYSIGHSKLLVAFNSSFNSDLKVSWLYNIGHNKWKELLPTKLQFKVDKNPMWPGSWMLLDVWFPIEKSLLARPWKMLCTILFLAVN
jgi:hypothetical protein